MIERGATLGTFHVERQQDRRDTLSRKLGRGLGTLLGGDQADTTASPLDLDVDLIRPNPNQPRRVFDPGSLEGLRDSIQEHGILQPVVVRKTEDGYELILGERRLRAARLAGLRSIPAIVRADVPTEQRLELALVENVQREDLNPIERALGYKQMMGLLDLTQDEVAQRVGLRRPTVANHLRLLELPQAVQDGVSQGLITMGHARAMLGLPPQEMRKAMELIVRRGMSVREVERLAGGAGRQSSSKRGTSKPPPWQEDLESRMRERLGCRVSLRQTGYRGRITIEFNDKEELDRLAGILAPRPAI